MPIKPIDLQTLFGQMEQVGRERAAGKDGNAGALQQALQGAALVKKREEEAKAVGKPEAQEDGAGAVRDREGGREREREARDRRGGTTEPAEEPEEPKVITDPALGSRVDLTG